MFCSTKARKLLELILKWNTHCQQMYMNMREEHSEKMGEK